MKNPWINYIAARIGIFAAILAVMLIVGFDPFYSALISAVLSLAISLLFLGKQRSALSAAIYERNQRKHDRDTVAEDSAIEKSKK